MLYKKSSFFTNLIDPVFGLPTPGKRPVREETPKLCLLRPTRGSPDPAMTNSQDTMIKLFCDHPIIFINSRKS